MTNCPNLDTAKQRSGRVLQLGRVLALRRSAGDQNTWLIVHKVLSVTADSIEAVLGVYVDDLDR